MTCTLYGSSLAVTAALVGLLQPWHALLDKLDS